MKQRKRADGALEDSTTVGFAKANSEIKDLYIAIGKAANYIESPPKERHVRTWDCSAWDRTYTLFLEERHEWDDNNREYDRPEARAVSSKPLKRLSKIVPATYVQEEGRNGKKPRNA
ncbi:hypothetical protein YC2023_036192 [Brassica napus]